MRCFVHRDVEAVGTCRACNKGLCGVCVVDLRHSISCKGSCENKANVLNTQLSQSQLLLGTQRRSRYFLPALFLVMGTAFMIFAKDDNSVLNLGTVMGSGFIVFGIIFAALNHRYAKELDKKA